MIPLMVAKPDPRVLAPVGSYQTDETILLVILESEESGALGEDVASGLLVEISARELGAWRRIEPDGLGGVRERETAA